ncbi:PRC-barrel domain containing protein [Streptomyces sp. NBC_01235]|uniref:PRC-barrel domain containing protein n=1 Tax=Streptomyces sp. NBC_01235 TaxID=2903788 RepID=UPI002E10F2FF|nr:PRC-barrel domain containing protein [Streptomyces sp. NBC_01235]
MTIDGIWAYAPGSGHVEGHDPTGYAVVTADGTLGHVEREAGPHGLRHLVVDTGVWLFGRSAVVPVGVVARVDHADRKVSLACTGEDVKEAPRFRTDSETTDPAYLAAVGDHYRRLTPRGTTPA